MMHHLTRRILAATIGLISVTASVATAGPVLYIDDSSNRLGTVDVGSGAVHVVGKMGGNTMTDIAFSPTGVLYGISLSNLYTINASTAATTLVGALGQNGENALVFGANGTLYAAGTNGNLYTVNTTTGHETLIGATGFASSGDLAFNQGQLYLSSQSNQLIRLNLSTGAGTVVGSLGYSKVYGLATGDNGVLYGVAGNTVFSINTTTGAGTFDLTYGGGLGAANGTSFYAETTFGATVPEPSSLVLSSLAAGVIATAAWARRKRANG